MQLAPEPAQKRERQKQHPSSHGNCRCSIGKPQTEERSVIRGGIWMERQDSLSRSSRACGSKGPPCSGDQGLRFMLAEGRTKVNLIRVTLKRAQFIKLATQHRPGELWDVPVIATCPGPSWKSPSRPLIVRIAIEPRG